MESKLIKLTRPPVSEIPPLPEGIDRPLWSVMIPCYNPVEKYLIETIESVLVQCPDESKMQIEIVDDYSDKVDIKSIVDRAGQGRIIYTRLPRNMGHALSFTECIKLARGKLIHILHNDDKVKPGFYARMENIFDEFKTAGAAYCRQEYIDDNGDTLFYSEPDRDTTGILDDAISKLAERQRVQYCGMVVKRESYEKAGGFVMENIGGEDWEMWVRLASKFPIAYEPEALACYRVHKNSMTSTDKRTGLDIRSLKRMIDIFNDYLPADIRKESKKTTEEYYADYSLKNAVKMLEVFDDEEGAAAQLSETIRLDPVLVSKNRKILEKIRTPVDAAGVSVVVCTQNDEEKISGTIRNLTSQNVPKYIPWEIILVDNDSGDDTVAFAVKTWQSYRTDVKLKVISIKANDVMEWRSAGITNSLYDNIIFCNPGDILSKNYIRRVSEEMMKDKKIGLIGGFIEPLFESKPPEWFAKFGDSTYETGYQYDTPGLLTWSKGSVWSTGMVIRKKSWESVIEKNFKTRFNGSEKIKLGGFDKEIGRALRSDGWKIIFDVSLLSERKFSRKDLGWNKLRELKREEGKRSVILDEYDRKIIRDIRSFSEFSSGGKELPALRKHLRMECKRLRTLNREKLLTYHEQHYGDLEITEMEYTAGRIVSLLEKVKGYNKKLRIIKKIFAKKDLPVIKSILGKSYFRFPQYRTSKDKRGISIILNFTGTSYNLLSRALEKIAVQELPENFPSEVIIMSNFMKDEVRREIFANWKKSRSQVKLRIEENSITKTAKIKEAALTLSKFGYILFISENDLLDPDFVRIAYRTMELNDGIAVSGGQTNAVSDVRPPGWLGRYKELFSIGQQSSGSGDITHSKGYLWNTGIVIRKEALEVLVKADLSTEQIERTSVELFGLADFEALKNKGWKLRYEERLISGRYLEVSKLSWDHLRKLFYLKGMEEVSLNDRQLTNGENGNGKNEGWISNAARTIGMLGKYPLKKVLSKENEFKDDSEVLEIEKLQGRLSRIIKNKKSISINGNGSNGHGKNISVNENVLTDKGEAGISIVICCYNSSKVLPATLRAIAKQDVPADIKWEVIVVDNASTDGTSETARIEWKKHDTLVKFKVVKENEPGLSAARKKGFEAAEYDYIIFCDDDNMLDRNFVRKSFEIMQSDKEIGVLGGQSVPEFEDYAPYWFNDWKDSFAIGKQSDSEGDVTWSRGYVWGAAMVVRKSSWQKLIEKGFKPRLTDRKGEVVSSGGDTEICYALRNDGWKIWYSPELRFRHFISPGRLNWNYVRKLFRGFGIASAGLDHYQIKISSENRKKIKGVVSGSSRKEFVKSLRALRKTRYKKLLTFDKLREGDSDIPMLEYHIGRIEGILASKRKYNSGLRSLKRSASKKDLRYLKAILRKDNSAFPRYKHEVMLNGVSVIVCTYNGEDRLADTVRHIATQKTDKRLLWELILVDNASTDNTKNVVIEEWKKHKVNATLKIVDEYEQGLSAARQKGFDTARYEYQVLCDDDNWLDENFVQLTYDIMSSNKEIGILGGPNEPLCELGAPEWFKWFQQGYAGGIQADLVTGKESEGNITWKRGFVWGAGMIIRRKALKDLYAKGFTSLMSDRKGYQLSSGGDSELCYALVLSGWQVWYDKRLKLKHCMPAGRLTWNYLIRLFEGFGITSVGLDYYEKAIRLGRNDVDADEIRRQNWKYEYKKTYDDLKKYGWKKLLSLRFSQEENTQVPMIEYHLARLKELRRVKDEYDRNLEMIFNAKWKADPKMLRAAHRKFVETEHDHRYGWPWGKEPESRKKLEAYPKISILSPSFNSQNTIEKAILSVLNQNYPDFEHIICDGGSTDETVAILKKYPHLKWVSEKDKGQCDAMNKAFEMATGDIISYLNVDDYYQRGVFHKIAEAFNKDKTADIVVGNLYFEYDDHTFIRKPETGYKKIMLPFKYIFPINPVSYFYKKKVQEETGPFPLDNHYTMDYWFLLKAFQKNKVIKIEDYLGTFCMNGFNKTSGADNRKNTHHRVIEHCWKHDKKSLPFYLYQYYRHYYYEEKPYNLKRVYSKLRKNLGRIYSIVTFRKNKYYAERLYLSSRSDFFMERRMKSTSKLMSSYVIYPRGLFQRSRQSLLVQSALGQKKFEKVKKAYFFLTTPPGLPLSNKLYYYGGEFKKENKKVKGNSLLLLTYIISPKFLFKNKRQSGSGYSKIRRKFSFRRLLHTLNPVNWVTGIYSFFRYRKYKQASYRLSLKAGDRYYHHHNIRATFYMLLSFLVYPVTLRKRSRQNLFAYSLLGDTMMDKVKFTHALYKSNPELTFAHKLNYYGNDLRKKNQSLKGNAILLGAYLLSPKYILKREKIKKANIVFVSSNVKLKIPKTKQRVGPPRKKSHQIKYQLRHPGESVGKTLKNAYLISGYKMKEAYYYFRYRKFKARSKELYLLAVEDYNSNRRLKAAGKLIPSYLLYPVSVFNRNKLGLLINAITGRKPGRQDTSSKKFEN